MVNNESVLITSAIEAHKRKNVVTLDISGVYLHTETDEEVKWTPNCIKNML